jgi:hypothetical protein
MIINPLQQQRFPSLPPDTCRAAGDGRGDHRGTANACPGSGSVFTLPQARNTPRPCSGTRNAAANSVWRSRAKSLGLCVSSARHVTDGYDMARDTGAFWCGAFRIGSFTCQRKRAFGSSPLRTLGSTAQRTQPTSGPTFRDPSSSECFSAIRYLLSPPRLLPAGATSCRVGLSPTGDRRLCTAHR